MLKRLFYDFTMDNKAISKKFLQLVSLGHVHQAYETFVSPDLVHHNQYFEGDRDSLFKAMADDSRQNLNRSFTVKQSIEEGDKVVTYSHVVKTSMEIAVVHIFRIRDGKIIELWDVGQIMDEGSPNQHGLF